MARIPGAFVPLSVHIQRDMECVSPSAELLYVRALAYIRLHSTAGLMTKRDTSSTGLGLKRVPSLVAELVAAGFWIETDGGWLVRSYAKWNAADPQVSGEIRAQQQAAERTNHTRWHLGRDVIDPTCHLCPAIGSDNGTESQEREEEREREEEEEKDISSEVADAPIRHDVKQILDALDDRLKTNGVKAPGRTKRNLDAARMLLDRDGHTVAQVLAAIDFATTDEFWRSNVLSMSKLRDQYDRLRLAAQRSGFRPGLRMGTTDQRVVEHAALIASLERRETPTPDVRQIGA